MVIEIPATRQITIFTRYPVAGTTKTRLILTLGAEKAALLQRRMTEHAVAVARAFRQATPPRSTYLHVSYAGGTPKDFLAWLGNDIDATPQPPGDLGARLHRVSCEAYANGISATIIIGSDIPTITPELLAGAFRKLEQPDIDVVIGPASDGGYYLIGMKRPQAALFEGIAWGTGMVRQQTFAACRRLGLRWVELPMLSDVDTADDLTVLRGDPRFADIFQGKPLISIIIPTLNEAAVIATTLAAIPPDDSSEVIVVDGGSTDKTVLLATRAGATILRCGGGRAAQLNAGAQAARGRILLFLHADTCLPVGYGKSVRHALQSPATVAGAFRFATDGRGWSMRLVEWMTNLRATLWQWPYGDQAIFLEKRIFDEMGGFPVQPIMEDYALVERLRRRGRIMIVPQPIITSARRWQTLGVWRTTLVNQVMILGYRGGISVETLRQLYRGTKEKHSQNPLA